MTDLVVIAKPDLLALIREAVREELAHMPTGPARDEDLTTKDVCAEMGFCQDTLWRKRREKVNPFPAPVRQGNRVRYLRSDIEAWKARRPRVGQ